MDETNNILLKLIEKATNTAWEGITLSAMDLEDEPLIYINEGFERLTGYSREEAIGKNCRFLQGEGTNNKAVDEIRQAIKDGQACTVELLNYKKDKTPFWNRLSITPLKNDDHKVTHYVGVQSDITELRETQSRLELANEELEKFQKKIKRELNQANKAQKFILPDDLPIHNKIRFSARYEPKGEIGGDYYDVIELKDGVFGILIADVTGHGIPAALLTFMTSFAFKNSAPKFISPSKVVSLTNKQLINKMPQGAFITMFYAIYDSESRVLTYTQAGHPPGFIVRSSTKEALPLATGSGLVGVFAEDKMTFNEDKITLQSGDKLILYTDAIIESRRGEEMIEMEGFTDFLISNCQLSISDLFDKIYQFGIDFSGKSSYDDDFTMVGFEVLS